MYDEKDVKELKKTLVELREGAHDIETVRGRRPSRPRKERREAQREAVIPKSRICPLCDKLKLRSKQWVSLGTGAVCLSCFRKVKAKQFKEI